MFKEINKNDLINSKLITKVESNSRYIKVVILGWLESILRNSKSKPGIRDAH